MTWGMGLFSQELEQIINLPSLPSLAKLHSLPSFAPACLIEDALSSPGTAIAGSERAARDERSGMTQKPASKLARQTVGSTAPAEAPMLATGADSNKAPGQVKTETKCLYRHRQ